MSYQVSVGNSRGAQNHTAVHTMQKSTNKVQMLDWPAYTHMLITDGVGMARVMSHFKPHPILFCVDLIPVLTPLVLILY